MAVPEGILARIRKLSAMTEANGAAATEAEMAIKAIARLVAEHGIQESDLELKSFGSACISRSLWTFGSAPNLCVHMFPTIASVFECKTWISPGWADPLELGISERCVEYIFFGFPADVDICCSLAQLCMDAFAKGQAQRRKDLDRNSFGHGFVQGLKAQVSAMRPIINANKSGGLVVLKYDRVKEEQSRLGLNLGPIQGRGQTLDSRAFLQGRAAGHSASLQPKVSAPNKRISAQ